MLRLYQPCIPVRAKVAPSGRSHAQIILYAFDLLELDSGDLRPLPLDHRKVDLQATCVAHRAAFI